MFGDCVLNVVDFFGESVDLLLDRHSHEFYLILEDIFGMSHQSDEYVVQDAARKVFVQELFLQTLACTFCCVHQILFHLLPFEFAEGLCQLDYGYYARHDLVEHVSDLDACLALFFGKRFHRIVDAGPEIFHFIHKPGDQVLEIVEPVIMADVVSDTGKHGIHDAADPVEIIGQIRFLRLAVKTGCRFAN